MSSRTGVNFCAFASIDAIKIVEHTENIYDFSTTKTLWYLIIVFQTQNNHFLKNDCLFDCKLGYQKF